jgi:hypothetical protein
MKAIVFYSGGLVSWGAAKRTVRKYGAENTTLLFTDTLIESPGLYRFLEAGAANVGARLVRVADGRTPFQVFRDVKMLGNSQTDPCSRILKREPGERWLRENRTPDDTVLVFGLDWTEGHRFDDGEGHGVKPRYAKLGWAHVEAPMMDAPYIDRQGMLAWARLEGLPVSDAYPEGFAHDNCGGGCVKAGKGHFAHLLRTRPQVYAYWEDEEQAFNDGRPDKRRQTILRDEKKGEPSKPLSLRELRHRIEGGAQVDMFDIGGCGCFVSADA